MQASSGPIPLRLNAPHTQLSTGCGCAVEKVRTLEPRCEYEQRLGPKRSCKAGDNSSFYRSSESPKPSFENGQQSLDHTARSPATMASSSISPLCLPKLLLKLGERKATARGRVATGRSIYIWFPRCKALEVISSRCHFNQNRSIRYRSDLPSPVPDARVQQYPTI